MKLVRRLAVLAVLVTCLGQSQDNARADNCYEAARERYEQCWNSCQMYINHPSTYYGCEATCSLNYQLDVDECNNP